MSAGPLVLCYHGVSADVDHLLLVSPAQLRRQLAYLRRLGYRGASAEAVVGGGPRALHATFDDAFVNVLEALPALEEHAVPATVFACSGLADDGSPPAPLLAEDVPAGTFATLRWDGLRELLDRGVTIGSHTVSHPHLPELGQAELEQELAASRERLEDMLGVRCPSLAYPFGENDARVREAARKAGYEVAWGLPGDSSWSDRYNLPRAGVWRKDHLLRFAAKTSTPARRRRRALAR
jgi:peptidoglycan/xylan/chitin deacetylase (PgdA/CDA1 family)